MTSMGLECLLNRHFELVVNRHPELVANRHPELVSGSHVVHRKLIRNPWVGQVGDAEINSA